jgi:hypothetical protein
MTKRSIFILSMLAVVRVSHADSTRRSQEQALAKPTAMIQRACENPKLALKIDWAAFEKLDYQALIGAGLGWGDNSRANDARYVDATRTFILTGEKRQDDVSGSPASNFGGTAASAFQIVCRDHPELRTAAARITTIVLAPIADIRVLGEAEKLAFARRTGDWTAVAKAFSDEKRGVEADKRIYRPRFAVNGTTLVLTQNVFARSGDADDFAQSLSDALGGSTKPARSERSEKSEKTERSDEKRFGQGVDCERGDYADLPTWEKGRYTKGALVMMNWSAEPTQVYRCTRGSCGENDSPGSEPWALVGHCSR